MTDFGPLQALRFLDRRLAAWEPCNWGKLAASQSAAPQLLEVFGCVKKVNIHINVSSSSMKKWLLYSPTENGTVHLPNAVSLSLTDRVQRADLLLHQHRGRVHPLPRRGLPEAGLPGDQGVHPGSPPLAEGEPAAGESQSSSAPTGGGTGRSHLLLLLLLFLLMYTHLSKLTHLSFAGTSPALGAPAPRCHGDESGHKCQAGRHDVSQDLYSEARQCQVGPEV